MDVTWDDPVGPGETFCRHSNFMVDRAGMIATGHDSTDWIDKSGYINAYDSIAGSSRYADYFWKDILTAIPLIGTKAGYLSEGKLNVFDFADNSTSSYDRNIGEWKVWNTTNRWWNDDYCSMVAVGDAFYYTTQESIYQMTLDGASTPIYTLSSDETSKGLLYGLTANGKNLIYTLQTDPYGDVTYTGSYRIYTAIDNFVARMYRQCLYREPDLAGLDGWVGQLEGGYMDGAAVAQQFVFSQEMLKKNLSDTEFVKVLYRAMMGREADENGLNGWVGQLKSGYMTRSEVTKAFVESTEFSEICASYEIIRGTYDASVAPIEHFVGRFYTLCLERDADQAGLYGWVDNLKNQYMNGALIANSFFFSDEFINKNVTDEKYVELLYNTLMGRKADENGKAGWLGELQNGYMTRADIMKAFIESNEFTEICHTYGIVRGAL